MITQNMASTNGAWCTFPSISAAAAPAFAAAGATLANQKLRSSAGQSEASTGIGTTQAVTVFCTKPPIMPYFSEYSSLNQRGRIINEPHTPSRRCNSHLKFQKQWIVSVHLLYDLINSTWNLPGRRNLLVMKPWRKGRWGGWRGAFSREIVRFDIENGLSWRRSILDGQSMYGLCAFKAEIQSFGDHYIAENWFPHLLP